MGSFSFLRREMRRDLDRERRSVVVPEWAVVHSEVSCSDWLLVSLAALWDLNIFLQKSFLPSRAPGICSSLGGQRGRGGGRLSLTYTSLSIKSTSSIVASSLFEGDRKQQGSFLKSLPIGCREIAAGLDMVLYGDTVRVDTHCSGVWGGLLEM